MADWIGELRPGRGETVPEPASRPDTITEAERVLGVDATRWAVQTAATVCDGLEAAAREDSDLRLSRQACEASLLTVLMAWRSTPENARDLSVTAPSEALEQVRLTVRQGASVRSVLRGLWLCDAAVEDALLAVVGRTVPPESLVDEIRRLTRHLRTCADQLLRELAADYEAELAAWQEGIAARRRQVLEEIVDTGRVPAGAEQVLGANLSEHHIAGVMWSVEGRVHDDRTSQVSAYTRRLADAIGAKNTLVVGQVDGSLLLLWSLPADPAPGTIGSLRAVERPPRHALALGPVGRAVAGLRDSVLGARQLARTGQRVGRAETWLYDNDALLALLAADFGAAGRFARITLSGLTGRDAKSDGVRETLLAYLRHGRSRSAAGRELNLAPTTVAYRVRQAEESLGRPAAARPDETVAALLLARTFPGLLGEDAD